MKGEGEMPNMNAYNMYNPYYSGQQNYMNSGQSMNNNGINWVQGVEGAKAYQLMPNSNVVLIDSEQDRFYIKSADNIGMCTLRTFDYKEVTDAPSANTQSNDMSQYVRRDELQEILRNWRGGKQNGKQSVQSNEPTTAK
jgi:hypothetical protein